MGSLEDYYETNFILCHSHKTFSLTELENMLPYERDIYIALIRRSTEEQKINAVTGKRPF